MIEHAVVNGTTLGYEVTPAEVGPDNGEAVVFLNGIAMTTIHWKPFVEALPGYRRLTHDFKGQVLSDQPPGPYKLSEHAADLDGLLTKLGIRRVHIVGTSYGSAVGFLYAFAHPEKVASMVVIDGTGDVSPLLQAAIEGWRTAAQASPQAFYENLIPWTYSAEWLDANRKFLSEREAAICTFPKSYFDSFVALCDAFIELDVMAELGRITCPALVLEGEKDILTAGCGQRLAAAIKGARFALMPGAGHAEVVEAPGPLVAEMTAFLSGIDGAGQRARR